MGEFREASVMVPAGTMDVTVLEFFGAGFADVDDFNIKVERLAGQWMIRINLD